MVATLLPLPHPVNLLHRKLRNAKILAALDVGCVVADRRALMLLSYSICANAKYFFVPFAACTNTHKGVVAKFYPT